MSESRLDDYLDHMRLAATDACSFVDGLSKLDFLAYKRTQQAVILSLIVIGEAATKIMDQQCRVRRPASGSALAQYAKIKGSRLNYLKAGLRKSAQPITFTLEFL